MPFLDDSLSSLKTVKDFAFSNFVAETGIEALTLSVLPWRSIAIALTLLLPTGCVTVASSVVGAGASAVGAYYDYKGAKKGEPVIMTPPIEAYSKVQDAAVAEMKSLNAPCLRDTVNVSDCLALKRLVIDHGDLRQRI